MQVQDVKNSCALSIRKSSTETILLAHSGRGIQQFSSNSVANIIHTILLGQCMDKWKWKSCPWIYENTKYESYQI